MAIADILLCIDPTTVAEGRLKLAVNLAQAHKAHLNTCYIMPEERGALIGTGIAGVPVIPAVGMVGIARTLSPGVAAAVVPFWTALAAWRAAQASVQALEAR